MARSRVCRPVFCLEVFTVQLTGPFIIFLDQTDHFGLRIFWTGLDRSTLQDWTRPDQFERSGFERSNRGSPMTRFAGGHVAVEWWRYIRVRRQP
ncbi:hypothetical protein LguiB_023506 [Lonicera macranthoides]